VNKGKTIVVTDLFQTIFNCDTSHNIYSSVESATHWSSSFESRPGAQYQ
jgi:hypothetical protein